MARLLRNAAEDTAGHVRLRPIPELVRFRTAEAAVTGELRRAILEGDLEPGERILQADLAKSLQTSITPVRSALRELAAEGLVRIEPYRSVVVHDPSDEELREVHRMRVLLEPSCIASTAARITEAQLAEAEAILENLEKEQDARRWAVLNREFHANLVQASDGPRLKGTIVNLLSLSALHITYSLRINADRMQRAAAEHRAILVACRNHNRAEASGAAYQHLMSSKRDLPGSKRASEQSSHSLEVSE